MTLHLIKLAVGADSPESMAGYQSARAISMDGPMDGRRVVPVPTRMRPKREADLLDGGSLFWVVRGEIRVRQQLVALEGAVDGDGRAFCRILVDSRLVPVRPRPQRPFQGWRYLTAEQAPADLATGSGGDGDLPPDLARELRGIGVL